MQQSVFSNRNKDLQKLKFNKLISLSNIVLNNFKFGLKRKVDYISFYKNTVSKLENKHVVLPKNLDYLFRNITTISKPNCLS